MDYTYVSKQNRGHSNLCRFLLLLFLAGLWAVASSAGEQPVLRSNGVKVSILGPDYVTVGVPASVECDGNCLACTYSLSLDGQSARGQGNVLAFTVNSWVEALTVTCTATNDKTNATATTAKQLQVLAGPANVSITGPDLMNTSMSYTYSCHAYCQPSCSYAWKIDEGAWIGGQGNMISITPRETHSPIVLICKATNSVSGMFVSATQKIAVASGPSRVHMTGPDTIELSEKNIFTCTAECLPSCDYTSSVDGQTVRGNVIEIEMDHPLKSVSLKCEAQNTASRETATALKIIKMKGQDSNIATHLEETSAMVLLAFMISAAFTL